jgi:hypothetical protein
MKGDGSGDRARSSDPGLLERDRHPCPGEACAARSQRYQARRGERSQPDERRSDRVADVQRVQHGCAARDAAGGGERRPGEDGRAEPEPGQPVPPAGDRHDQCEWREQQPGRQDPGRGSARTHECIDGGARACDREAGAAARPPALGGVDVACEQPDPDRVAETRRQHHVRQRPEPIAAPGLVQADLAAGRPQRRTPGAGRCTERDQERGAAERDRRRVKLAQPGRGVADAAVCVDAARRERADPGEGGDGAERRRERELPGPGCKGRGRARRQL